MARRPRGFVGVEGQDYHVLYTGGRDPEIDTFENAFQVLDLLRLSQRASKPRSRFYKSADKRQIKQYRSVSEIYLGNHVAIAVVGGQVDPETGIHTPFVLPDDSAGLRADFFYGVPGDFAEAYTALVRDWLEQLEGSGQEYGTLTLVAEIWIRKVKRGTTPLAKSRRKHVKDMTPSEQPQRKKPLKKGGRRKPGGPPKT